jgi:hypothetical protein
MQPQQDEMWIEVLKWMQPQQNWEIFEDIYLGAKPPYEKKIGYRYPAHSGWILAPPLTLDALHEAEKNLTSKQKNHYIRLVAGNNHYLNGNGVFASKEQRLLALWRTIGSPY